MSLAEIDKATLAPDVAIYVLLAVWSFAIWICVRH